MTRSPLIRHIGCPSEPTETGLDRNSQNKIYKNFETSISYLGPQGDTTCKILAKSVRYRGRDILILLESYRVRLLTRLENSEKIEFLQTRPKSSPTGTSYKNIVLSSINQKLFFKAIFSFRCPKSAKIDQKWAAYSEARKPNSKTLDNKLVARRILYFLSCTLRAK